MVSNLSVTPMVLEKGGSLEISYVVENSGEYADDYIVETFITGDSIDVSRGMLDIGETAEIMLTVEQSTLGRYQVTVEGMSECFEVVTPVVVVPASFIIESIESVPESVTEGALMSVFVTVSNEGDVSGETTVDLLLDQSVIDSRQAVIPAQSSESLIFEVAMDYNVGVHEFSVNGYSAEVTVTQQERELPVLTISLLVLILVAVVAYWLRTQNII